MSDEFDTLFDEKESVVKKEEMVPEKEEIKEIKKPKIKEPRKPREVKPELHVLNENNLIIFIKQTNRTKKYEMKHRFYDATAFQIDEIVEKLIKEGKLERFKHGWIGIKEN